MISEQAFSGGYGLLCKQHNREYDKPLAKVYRKLLSEYLGDTEFTAAVQKSLFSDQFWPTPQQLVEHVRPSVTAEDLAIAAWELVTVALCNPAKGIFLDVPGEAALRSVGGLKTLSMVDIVRELPHRRRSFIAAYKAANGTEQFYPPIGATTAQVLGDRARARLEASHE